MYACILNVNIIMVFVENARRMCVCVRQGETVNEVEIIAGDNNNNNTIMTDGAVRKQ